MIFQMVGRARRGQNERIPPPPPPPPTLQELMAQQNEILRQLAQRQPPPQHYGGGDHQRHPAAATYQEFLSTQPLLFTRAEDPLDADVWLRVVESKFPLLHGVCSEVTKVRFATQQLRGPREHGGTTFLLCSQLTMRWNGESSRRLSGGHHIPAGIMDRKLNEFLALTQGNRTVLQYAQAFNDLCQYAGYHADTDEKKRDRFRRGLSTKLRDRLNTIKANSYNEIVNMAISGGLYHSSLGRKEEEDPCGRTFSSATTLQDRIWHSEQRTSAAARTLGDPTTAVAAGTQPHPVSSAEEQSATAEAVPPGQ
jgi:hypothetical protein